MFRAVCVAVRRLHAAAPRLSVLRGPLPDVALPSGPFVDFALERVDAHPHRSAFIDGTTGERIPYSQLLPLVDAVAGELTRRRFTAAPDATLTIFAANCWEAVVVYHAVMAVGGRVHLVSCHATPHELRAHLRTTRPSLLLVTPELCDTAAAAARAVGGVQDIFVAPGPRPVPPGFRAVAELLQGRPGLSPRGAVDIRADAAAVLPHSSGTSGLPKTVALSHANLGANVAQGEPLFDLADGAETLLACLPFYHIYSPVLVYAFGLRRAASHVVLPRFEPEAFLRCVERFGVTFLHLVPPLVLFLTHSAQAGGRDLSSVRRAFCAAAPLHPETHDAFVARLRTFQPKFDFVQGYGMTELSPLCHMAPRRSLRPGEKSGSVGVVIPNTECRVVRVDTNRDVGPGEEGEILIRGPQVTAGYLDRPEETQLLIREGWVHTGDIGTYDEDGYFYINDRVKELIKYKGEPVAPAELEAVLLSHPGVADCGVVGKKDARAGELPTAFVVRRGEVSARELCDFVAERLSRSKRLRGGVRFVAEIPKSASGKILRRLLRDDLNK